MGIEGENQRDIREQREGRNIIRSPSLLRERGIDDSDNKEGARSACLCVYAFMRWCGDDGGGINDDGGGGGDVVIFTT